MSEVPILYPEVNGEMKLRFIDDCPGCGSAYQGEKCPYCGRPHPDFIRRADPLPMPVWSTKRITNVSVSGANNDLKIIYKEGSYVPKISISGTNQDKTVYTDSNLSISISGVNNDVEVVGLEIIDDNVSGINNDLHISHPRPPR